MTASKNIRYIPAIDHIRAYAAMLVFFFHSIHHLYGKFPQKQGLPWPLTSNPFMAVIHEGHTGVAAFIVLSGFIFTYGSMDKNINYLHFLRNRILRIYPLMMTITFAYISMFVEKFTISGFICTVLPFQNTPAALHLGHFNLIFWTIAVELQFYLIFPFLNKLLIDKGLLIVIPILCLTMIIRVGGVLHGANPQYFSYWTIIGRLDQFVIGMMFAIIAKNCTLENRRLRWGGLLGGLGLFSALFIFHRLGGYPVVSPWKIIWPLIEGLLWGVTIVGYLSFMHERDNLLLQWIGKIGTISYSIYLLHAAIGNLLIDNSIFFAFFNDAYANCFSSTIVIILPTTIIISSLTYHLIEKPFLELRQSYLEPLPTKSTELNELLNNP